MLFKPLIIASKRAIYQNGLCRNLKNRKSNLTFFLVYGMIN
ncbi:hypothetical protein D932_02242 [Enterococcus casseliflavus 14-MB-W-14]|nr:hypothetical protein D932_02242 [Enterococcus casseliflavus 14-MB-W-14]EPH87396.1 hypothetical protein D922_04325 [Enterococcus faecalis 06-MB-DW-09]